MACFKALGDATRSEIVGRLAAGERSVLEIAEQFSISRPAISKHLRILRDAGVISERAEGRQRFYALQGSVLAEAAAWLQDLTGSGGGWRSTAAREWGVVSELGPTPRPSAERSEDWRVW